MIITTGSSSVFPATLTEGGVWQIFLYFKRWHSTSLKIQCIFLNLDRSNSLHKVISWWFSTAASISSSISGSGHKIGKNLSGFSVPIQSTINVRILRWLSKLICHEYVKTSIIKADSPHRHHYHEIYKHLQGNRWMRNIISADFKY